MEGGTLSELQQRNPDVEILGVVHPVFARFGRVLSGLPVAGVREYALKHIQPGGDVVYEAIVAGLESDEQLMRALCRRVYGEMPIELGWCYGRNSRLNALEFHKGPEVMVPVTDVVILVGDYHDIQWKPQPEFDSARAQAFFVPQGTAVELFPFCLHYAPLHVHPDTGFCTLVALPRQTNLPIEQSVGAAGEETLLFARNKWLMAHPEAAALVHEGAYVGIRGTNIEVRPLEKLAHRRNNQTI